MLFASSYLQGLAFNWFNSFFGNFLINIPEDQDNDTYEIKQSYAKLKKKLVQTFKDFDKEHMAERKMQAL